jgi:hypothetical protein
VQKMRADNVPKENMRINLRLSHLKPLVPAMLLAGYKRLTVPLVTASWAKAGILTCFTRAARVAALREAAQRVAPAVPPAGESVQPQAVVAEEGYGDPDYRGGYDSEDDAVVRQLVSNVNRAANGEGVEGTQAGAALLPGAAPSALEQAVAEGLEALAKAAAARDKRKTQPSDKQAPRGRGRPKGSKNRPKTAGAAAGRGPGRGAGQGAKRGRHAEPSSEEEESEESSEDASDDDSGHDSEGGEVDESTDAPGADIPIVPARTRHTRANPVS